MIPARPLALLAVALAGAFLASPVLAQNVTEIQISPPQVQLRLGDRTQVFATAYTQGGNVAIGVAFRWTSSDTNVVRVIADAQSPELGTLVGVGAGAAVVAAITGPGTGMRGFTTVTVTDPTPPPPVAPIAVAPAPVDSILPTVIAGGSLRSAVRIEAQRYQSPAACASGAVIGNGLIVTSYQAIRGADRVTVSLESGAPIADPQVLAYNVASDLAILRIAAPTFDSLSFGTDSQDGDYAWAVSYAGCQAVPSTTRVRLSGASGMLRHTGNLPEAGQGAALVSNAGALVAVINGDRAVAAPTSRIQAVLGDARSTPRNLAVADVGREENHLYGSLVARSDVGGSSARVTPLESWQWSTLAREAATPLTFTGPIGRYQVDLIVNGAVRASTTVRVTAGTETPVTLAPPVAAAPQTPVQQPSAAPPPAATPAPVSPPPQTVARKGGSAAVPIVIVALLGGGAAVCFTAGPCKKPDPDDGDDGDVTTGGISVTVPNP